MEAILAIFGSLTVFFTGTKGKIIALILITIPVIIIGYLIKSNYDNLKKNNKELSQELKLKQSEIQQMTNAMNSKDEEIELLDYQLDILKQSHVQDIEIHNHYNKTVKEISNIVNEIVSAPEAEGKLLEYKALNKSFEELK